MTTFSTGDGLFKAVAKNKEGLYSTTSAITDPNQSLETTPVANTPLEIPKEYLGEYIAGMVQRYGTKGFMPTLEEYKAYDEFTRNKKSEAWKHIGDAINTATSDLYNAGTALVGDTIQLKVPKVVGSVIEGTALGTKNWYYMYQQAKYDKNSWLSRAMFDNHDTIEDSYLAFQNAMAVQREVEKDQREGIWVPNSVTVGGVEIDLTNKAVVQGLSYIADPSWIMPNLGIEAALVKGLRGAGAGIGLGQQLSKAGAAAARKASLAAGKTANFFESIAEGAAVVDRKFTTIIGDATGTEHYIAQGGSVTAQEGIVRAGESALGLQAFKIPAWAAISGTHAASKVFEGVARLGEVGFKILGDEAPNVMGNTLSERIAINSTAPNLKKIAGFWSKTGTPVIDWLGQTSKTAMHSSMYGGVFGLAVGGEEGFYHGLGTGLVLGGAFHQIGVLHNTVSGGDAVQDTVKHFLWATEGYDRNNQEGTYHLLEEVNKIGGDKAKLSLMGQIAGAERLLKEEKMVILRESTIKELSTDVQWAEYERQWLDNPEWGGITFGKLNSKGKEPIIIVNADRAAKSAVSEELFHGIMLSERYGKAFQKYAMDALIGHDDAQGALYKMPKADAVRMLESFRDQYFSLDKETVGHIPEEMQVNLKKFNEAIEKFKNGEKATSIKGFFEEFLASYWNRFVEDKPIDYLIKGGDLGIIRNAIGGAKDWYKNIMRKDLSEAGVQFEIGGTADTFLLDKTTKQRVRIPMLEGLMKHYVKELKKGMYEGWEVDKKKYAGTDSMINGGLDHLFETKGEGDATIFVPKDDATVNKELSTGLRGVAEGLLALAPSDRGATLSVYREDGSGDQPIAQFARGNKPKQGEPVGRKIPNGRDWWEEQNKTIRKKIGTTGATVAEFDEMGVRKREKGSPIIKGRREQRVPADPQWETDTSGDFWESQFQGNTRVRIEGIATPKELAVFEKFLGENVARRIAQLNTVIEASKVGKTENISNILSAKVITAETVDNDGGRSAGTISERAFIPVELNMYFTAVRKSRKVDRYGRSPYVIGEAKLLLRVIDWDSYITREDYAFNKVNDSDLNYKTVQRLFGTRTNLREAVKAMLSNYSLGNKAQAGIKLFDRGKGGDRDAALKRDIVNAVIGYHPTKAMVNTDSGWYNTPREMQMLKSDNKVKLPTVMKNFRVDKIGTLKQFEGEGFRYNHNEAYKRAQANFSPAISHRDHEGYPIPISAKNSTADTHYRNKEGELLSVYALRTPYSSIREISPTHSVYDYVTGEFADAVTASSGSVRGHNYTSDSGWLHFTPDKYEAGFVEDTKIRSGYIDTQRHISISDIPFGTDYKTSIDKVAFNIANTSGVAFQKVMGDLLMLRDVYGEKLIDGYKAEYNGEATKGATLDEWLFTKAGSALLSKYNIHSVEYMAFNPVTGNEFGSVAIIQPSRFIENMTRKGMDNAMHSPSKTISSQFREQMDAAGSGEIGAMLQWRIDEKGKVVPNTNLITRESVDSIIKHNRAVVKQAQDIVSKGEDLTSPESIKRFEDKIKPFFISELRKKFPKAPSSILEQIATFSLEGYATYTKSLNELRRTPNPLGGVETYVPQVSVNADSAFIENATRYGITPAKLRETGLPSLGHWIELSEAEFQTLKNYPEWSKRFQQYQKSAVADARKSGILDDPKLQKKFEKSLGDVTQTALIKQVLAESNGITGLIDNMASRQKQLFFLMDGSMRGNGQIGSDTFNLSSGARKQLSELFLERNQAVLEFMQTFPSGIQEAGSKKNMLVQWIKAKELLIQSKRNLTAEEHEAIAMYEGYKRKAENIITNDAKTRMLDTLSAFHITEIDMDSIERIRTQMYLEDSKGLIELGTPEATARAVQLYMLDQGANGVTSLGKIQEAIKINYIKSLENLSKEGFIGVRWVDRELSASTMSSNNNGVFSIGGKVKKALHAWTFEGTDFAVLRKNKVQEYTDTNRSLKNVNPSDVILDMYDGNGGILARTEYSSTLPPEQIKMIETQFLRDGTNIINREVMAGRTGVQALVEGGYQSVQGKIKELIVSMALKKKYNVALDVGSYELYRNGDTFVMTRLDDVKIADVTTTERIAQLEARLKSGQTDLPNKIRPLRDNEKKQILAEIKAIEKALREPSNLDKRGVSKDKNPKFDDIDTARWEDEGEGVGASNNVLYFDRQTEAIARLKAKLKAGVVDSGKPSGTRPATLEEKIATREQITRLQGQKNTDLGFSFQINSRHQVTNMGQQFTNLKQRNEALRAIRSGREGNKAFEAYAKEAYVKFEKFIADKKVQEAKLLSQVIAEKGAVGGESVIPQISRLLDELNGLEKKSREFVINEAKKLKGNTKGKIDLEAMETKIKDRELELRDLADEWELKYLAVAEQLMDNGVLEQQGWTPDKIKELQDRISAHPNYGEIQALRQTPTGNSSMFITQLIDQMRVNQTEFAVAEKAHSDLTEFTVGKAEEIDAIKQQIYFLARRYTEAKGYTSSGDQFLISAKRTDYTTVSTFNFKGLKTYTNDKPHKPNYLRDSENVSGQSRAVRLLLDKKAEAANLYKSVAELTKEFTDGMLELGDHYNAGMTIKDLRVQQIIGYGRTEVNSELRLSSEMVRRTSKQNLTSGEFNWVNDPMNAEFVNAVDKQVKVGKMSIEDAISAIQREASIANIGRNGVLLGDTVKQLNLTIEKIGVIGSRLDVFGRQRLRPDEGQGNPFATREQGESSGPTMETISALAKYKKTAPQEALALRAELKQLRTQKTLLMERYENILKMAGKDAPSGFNEFVAQNKAEDLREAMARRNMKARNAEVKALRATREEDTLKLFKRYDDIARNLRYQNPALRFENSRVPVHPDDPTTQYIVYSFSSLAQDYFGPSWRQYDLRTARTSGENAGGITTPFQSDNPAGTSGNLRQWIKAEAKNLNARGVYLADYIHYAFAKREFLMKNPSVEMSAQDANLMKFFFKKDVEGGLFAERIADIPAQMIAQQEAMNNGIVETFSSKTEQERFIKSFVTDGLDLISHSEGLKREALKKLSGMNDEQFDKAYGDDPAALEKRLNTIEVIENAFMLIARGRIQVRDAGEVYNVRDLTVNKFTPEEQKRLESIRVMKGWTPAQLDSYLVRGLEQNTPKELRNLIGGKQQQFLTRRQVGNIPIDTLIRMEGFDAVWKEKMAAVTNESLFGLERQFGLKKAYEGMPINQRMALDAPTIKRLLLTNEKQNMKTAAELRKRYKKQGKAILDPEGMEEFGYGFTDSVLKDEQVRVDTLLGIAGAVEASMIRYKADSLQLTNKANEWVLDHMLSIDDNLRVSGAVRGKDNTIVIDWDNPDKPQFRDTIDGRYFIKRSVTTSKRGVTSERFHIFFKGEKFTSSKGREVFDLPTTRFAEVDNITQAQVAIRLFEDDVMRIKVSSDMIGGGRNKYDPVAVGSKPLPLQDPRQPMLGDWGAAGAFSKAVGSLYLENKGSHYFHQAMMKKLDGIGQYASTHYLSWNVNGKTENREILIYPRQIGILSKHWTRGVSPDGHTTWKYNKPVRADAPAETTSTAAKDSNTAATEAAPAISEADAMLNDASKWTIEQSVAPSATIPFEEWTVIKNKLGYTLIKVMDSKTQNHTYKLYNKASMFMADTHAEVEAMEHILEEELKKIHNGR